MKNNYMVVLLVLLFSLSSITCDETVETHIAYDEIVTIGWRLFKEKNYIDSKNKFREAAFKEPGRVQAYIGLGWCYMRLDSLSQALNEFYEGSIKLNPSPDLYAGWAFALNANNEYLLSNEKINGALTISGSWIFPYDTSYTSFDLRLLCAENYFALGDFPNSLTQIKILNPSFEADVSTVEGIKKLAAEIERLKG